MKRLKSTLSTIVLVTFFYPCLSQHIVSAVYAEKTVAGAQYGVSLSYQTKKGFNYGGFVQSMFMRGEEAQTGYSSFTGLLAGIPIARSKDLSFSIGSRVGFVDKKFLVFVPGVTTEFRIYKGTWMSIGTGLRMSYPSLDMKLLFKY